MRNDGGFAEAASGGEKARRCGAALRHGRPFWPCRSGIMRSRSRAYPCSGHPRPMRAVCHRHQSGGSHWTHPIVKHIFTCWPHTRPRHSPPRQRVATRKSPSPNEYPSPPLSERMATTTANRGGKESGTRFPDMESSEASFATGRFWRFVATRLFRRFGKRLTRLALATNGLPRQILATVWRKTSYNSTGICPIMTMKGVQNVSHPYVPMCE